MDSSKPDDAKTGIVYVMTNEAMPNLVKVGRTIDMKQRIADLSAPAGVPLLFECHFAAAVKDAARIEKTLHQLFSEYRVNPRREFFKLDPAKVVIAISIGEFTDVTNSPNTPNIDKDEEEMKAVEKAKARRPNLRLDAIGVKPGDVLHFARDQAVTAIVAADGDVDFEGTTMSLAAAAVNALSRMGYKTTTASGSIYWMFDGELLDERRRRMEAKQLEMPAIDQGWEPAVIQ